MGSLTFLLTNFLATEITIEGWFSFLLLCLKVGLDVGHVLSEWKAKVLLFVQKRTRDSLVVQTSSDSSLYRG